MAEIGAMGELVESISTTVMPGDLIIQILLRLPALSVLRFKSVCRVWLALFNLPIFIENHARMALSSTKKNQQPSSFIVISRFYQPIDYFFSFVRVPFLGGEPVDLELPFEAKPMNIEVVGSVNGLVCLDLRTAEKTIVLWNPATREYNFIPDPESLVTHEGSVRFGFAYDEITDCYKVIGIFYSVSKHSCIRRRPNPFKAEVYSTKTNAWTQVEAGDFSLLVDHKSCCNVVSGCPYWFASELSVSCNVVSGCRRFIDNQVLMWFNASNDSFGFQRLPQGGGGGEYGSWSVKTGLGVEADCPVAFGYSKPYENEYECSTALKYRITKLKRYDGDEDNNQMGEEDWILDSSQMRRVVGFWRKDKILAMDMESNLSVYDRHSAKLKTFPVWGDGSRGRIDVFDYTESLVSPFAVS